jgi:hypothetical protein
MFKKVKSRNVQKEQLNSKHLKSNCQKVFKLKQYLNHLNRKAYVKIYKKWSNLPIKGQSLNKEVKIIRFLRINETMVLPVLQPRSISERIRSHFESEVKRLTFSIKGNRNRKGFTRNQRPTLKNKTIKL